MESRSSIHPEWFSDGNLSTIIGNSYPSPNRIPARLMLDDKLAEKIATLDTIIRQTGFTFSNIAMMLSGAKQAAPEAVENISRELPRLCALIERKTFLPSSLASLLRGKAKRLGETLDILEDRWPDLEKIAQYKTSTTLARSLSGKGLDGLDEAIDRELALSKPVAAQGHVAREAARPASERLR